MIQSPDFGELESHLWKRHQGPIRASGVGVKADMAMPPGYFAE
jgi:hypothetical protein